VIRLRNDLYCVEWGVKLYSLTPECEPNANPTAKLHPIVSIQLSIVACPTYPDKFTRYDVAAQFIRIQ